MSSNELSIALLITAIFILALFSGFYLGRNISGERKKKKENRTGELSQRASMGQKPTNLLPESGYVKSREIFKSLFSTLIEIETEEDDKVFSILANFVTHNTCADYSALILRENGSYVIRGAAGLSANHLEKIKCIKFEKHVGWFTERNLPIILLGRHGDGQLKQYQQIFDESIKDVVIFPLNPRDEFAGMLLGITKKKGGEFADADEFLFSNISGILTFFIHNRKLNRKLRKTFTDVISTIATFLEKRDEYTEGHSQDVKKLAVELAYRLKCDQSYGKKFVEDLEISALLHDIGKIGIPDMILNKPGKLNDEEFEQIKSHPVIGAEMIKELDFLKDSVHGILHHHEKYDGTGYPTGIKGDEIPLAAQIISVADVYNALTTKRSYRDAFSEEVAINMMREMNKRNFNPSILNEFIAMIQGMKNAMRKKEGIG